MSSRDLAKNMLDRLPDDKMIFIVNILANIGELSGVDVYQGLTPNAETIEAMKELEEGGGTLFTGNTSDLFTELEGD